MADGQESGWYMCFKEDGVFLPGHIYMLDKEYAEANKDMFHKATQEELDAVNPAPSAWPEGYAEKKAHEWTELPDGYHEALRRYTDALLSSIPKSDKNIEYFKKRFEDVFKELQEVHGRTKSVCIGHKNEVWNNGILINEDICVEIIFV